MNTTCEERKTEALASRVTDIAMLWANETGQIDMDEDSVNFAGIDVSLQNLPAIDDLEDELPAIIKQEMGTFHEYGLCFDYVPEDTFDDQEQGYFRYQLSYGGPSEEFRFYTDANLDLYKIEFWFLDWFDGASVTLYDEAYDLMAEIFEDFKEIGLLQVRLDEANA